jgi:flavin reductase (DIM6/NTAB) family NADH-FMN oxidoreductase RutF
MSFRVSVEPAKTYLLLNHGPVTLVTSAHGGSRNVMAASWAMPLDFEPPKVVVIIDRNTLTRDLVEASGSFALNVPAVGLAAATVAVGGVSGRELDKFQAYGLQTFAADKIEAPLIEGCVAWLECRAIRQSLEEKNDLFVAEVVAAWADSRVFENGRWHFEREQSLRTLHYVAGGQFFVTGEPLTVPQNG